MFNEGFGEAATRGIGRSEEGSDAAGQERRLGSVGGRGARTSAVGDRFMGGRR